MSVNINVVIPTEQLVNELSETLLSKLNELLSPKEKHSPDKLLTRKQTAELLTISLPTLNQKTKTGEIVAHRLGKSIRYKWEDVEKALKKIRT